MKNILKKDYITVAIVTIALLGLSGCSSSTEYSPVNNHKPIVEVPSDQFVNIGESVKLTATVSDPDKEDVLTYLWRVAAKPKGSQLTLPNDTNTTISFTADKQGTYYLDFIASDELVSSKPKRVTVVASSLLGEWTADLITTKEKNQLSESEKIEVVEALSSNYKFIFLENGKVENQEEASWKHIKNGNYLLDDRKLQLVSPNLFFVMSKLNDAEHKFYYKRVAKK
jgi:hypothetical protein